MGIGGDAHFHKDDGEADERGRGDSSNKLYDDDDDDGVNAYAKAKARQERRQYSNNSGSRASSTSSSSLLSSTSNSSSAKRGGGDGNIRSSTKTGKSVPVISSKDRDAVALDRAKLTPLSSSSSSSSLATSSNSTIISQNQSNLSSRGGIHGYLVRNRVRGGS